LDEKRWTLYWTLLNTSRKDHWKNSGKILDKLHESHIITFFFILLCWVGIHCGFYKGSNDISNISYLNFCPQHYFSLFPHSRVSITIFFSVYIYVCTGFALYLSLYIISQSSPHSLFYQPLLEVSILSHPVLWFCKRKEKEMTLFLPALHAYIYFLYIAFH
jgi:hypothetical protein